LNITKNEIRYCQAGLLLSNIIRVQRELNWPVVELRQIICGMSNGDGFTIPFSGYWPKEICCFI